ncbi:vitamin K epoxide reductase family protein [Candidatus Uhrbacteria bacterium]|nr:vitamin K epoxide reductase family protein [Candidatus Uhrbacteria bacterium]
MKNASKRYIQWIAVLALCGVLLSVYSLLHKEGFTAGAFCNLNETFNCDVVNQGPYSEIFGIPVAVMGIIGYFFLLVATLLKMKHPEDQGTSLFLLLASLGGFGFALYLSGIEAFVLQTWCLVCLTSQGVITISAVLSVLNYRLEKMYD